MWDFIESLPHGMLVYVLKAALALKTLCLFNFVSSVGYKYSIKHPRRDQQRCTVCYPVKTAKHIEKANMAKCVTDKAGTDAEASVKHTKVFTTF